VAKADEVWELIKEYRVMGMIHTTDFKSESKLVIVSKLDG
jgi:hypothetical protein